MKTESILSRPQPQNYLKPYVLRLDIYPESGFAGSASVGDDLPGDDYGHFSF